MNTEKKTSTGKKIALALIGILVVIIIIVAITPGSKEESKQQTKNNTASKQTATIQVGDVLKTEYFDVTVNKADISDMVNTGNEFTDVQPEQGVQFIILNVTFKNTDTESRMISEGELRIGNLIMDHPESILADGFGLFLDAINPNVSKTTNIVYKVSTDTKGEIYYNPGRSDSDELIYIGKL